MKPRARLSHSFSVGACVHVCVDTRVGERNTRSQNFLPLSPFLSVCLFHVLFELSVSCQADMIYLGEHSIYPMQHGL